MMQGRQQGYTLLEMVLVCGVLAILACTAGPFWLNRRGQQRVLSESLRLQAYLLALREQAFRSNGTRRVIFHPEEGCLVVQAQDDCQHVGAFVPQPPLRMAVQGGAQAGFFGLRNTAHPGHVRLSDGRRAARVIWSAQGRIRLCTEQGVPVLPRCDTSVE